MGNKQEYKGVTYATAARAEANYLNLVERVKPDHHCYMVVQGATLATLGRFYVVCFGFKDMQDGINMAMGGRGVYCVN